MLPLGYPPGTGQDSRNTAARREGGRPALTGATGVLAWHHTSVVVDDLDRAVAFHRGQLGFEVSLEVRAMAKPIQRMLGLARISCDLVQLSSAVGPHVLELIEFRDIPPDAARRLPIWPGRSHLAFVVPDLEAALRSMMASGGRAVGRITDFPEGPAVYCWAP